jgi:hypothetical protein
MNRKIAGAALGLTAFATLSIAATATGLPAGAANSPPPSNLGCPAGYQLLSVAALEAIGPYVAPREVDSNGNNDGYVCGHAVPLGEAEAICKNDKGPVACELLAFDPPLPVYGFRDDVVAGRS